MSSEAEQIVINLTRECISALFEEYGVPVTHEKSMAGPLQLSDNAVMAGVIGFTSEEMRGTVCLLLTQPLVRETHPMKDQGLAESALADWVGELANQMLGRLKNQLLKYGITLGMGTPITAAGSAGLRITTVDDATGEPWNKYSCKLGEFHVMLDCKIEEGVELKEVPMEAGDEAGIEGDMLLF